MKKLLIVALSLVAVFAFAGCSGQTPASSPTSKQVTEMTTQEYISKMQPLLLDMTGSFKNEVGKMLDIVMDGDSSASFELYQKVAKSCNAITYFKGVPEDAKLLHSYLIGAATAEESAAYNLYLAADKIKTDPSTATRCINDANSGINDFNNYVNQADSAIADLKSKLGKQE